MSVKAIRKWSNIYALLFIISMLITVLLFRRSMFEISIVFGCAAIVLLILLIKQNQLLKSAELIRDNCILVVPSAVITTEDGKERSVAEHTVVSVFGILMGSKLYKWGCDGVHGVRLYSVIIEKAYICLTFGDSTESTRVCLLHGLVDEQEVLEVKEKLWRETAVTAKVSGW